LRVPLALDAQSVGIADTLLGVVYFDPNPGDLVTCRSPYSVRWKVSVGGKVSYYPRSKAVKS